MMLRRGQRSTKSRLTVVTTAAEAKDFDAGDDIELLKKRRSNPGLATLWMLLLLIMVLFGGFYFWFDSLSLQNRSSSSSSLMLVTNDNTSSIAANLRLKDPALMNSFPRWGDEGGIELLPLLNAVQANLEGSMTRPGTGVAPQQELPYETAPTFQRIYLVDVEGQLWVALAPNRQSQMVQVRAGFMEPLLIKTLEAVFATKSVAASHLYRAVLASNGGGLLYVVSYGDAIFCCNDDRDRNKQLFPVLTLSAPVGSDCQFAFPIPTYETIICARNRQVWAQRRIIPLLWEDRWLHPPYWWIMRERKAVWRGSPTGPSDTNSNLRWRLCEQLGQHHPDLFDAKFHSSVDAETTAKEWPKLRDYPHLQGERIDTRDFQRYRAVIDLDGNSWSSRFGELLCYSSVVIKVEPRWVDYFYPELQAWRHYIPAKADLSDLVERVEFAVSDQNTVAVQQIINNANQWCEEKMKPETLVRDMAHILDVYAELMLRNTDSASVQLREQVVPKLLRQYNFTRLTAAVDS